VIRDARWEAGPPDRSAPADPDARCAHCEAEVGEVHVLLVRHRGEHRIADSFCDVEHLAAWAKAGGRWQ
jgi:hypothetical protein